jgi:hypothetical protein
MIDGISPSTIAIQRGGVWDRACGDENFELLYLFDSTNMAHAYNLSGTLKLLFVQVANLDRRGK